MMRAYSRKCLRNITVIIYIFQEKINLIECKSWIEKWIEKAWIEKEAAR